MIEHVYLRAAAARLISRVIVATDDPRIEKAVQGFGGEVRMTSAAHPSGTDRLAEVAADLSCDLIVNVQGDEPLIEPAMIDEAVEPFHHDPGLEMSTLRARIENPADTIRVPLAGDDPIRRQLLGALPGVAVLLQPGDRDPHAPNCSSRRASFS